jgi:P-type Ca2+ transporter type 2C
MTPLDRPWHTLAPDALAREVHSDLTMGLSDAEAHRRLTELGPNQLPDPSRVSPLILFLRQFSSVIIWVLIVAALVSGLLQDWADAGAIVAIVVLNAVMGFLQEYRAERSLAALKQMVITMARVVRGGTVHAVGAQDLVPGDLILLEAGDRIPADARLTYAAAVRTQEAALTGESTPVQKTTDVLGQSEIAIADRSNMLFFGTAVVAGRARALVVARRPCGGDGGRRALHDRGPSGCARGLPADRE